MDLCCSSVSELVLKTAFLFCSVVVQAAQDAVQQVADSSKETVNTGKVHLFLP